MKKLTFVKLWLSLIGVLLITIGSYTFGIQSHPILFGLIGLFFMIAGFAWLCTTWGVLPLFLGVKEFEPKWWKEYSHNPSKRKEE